MQAARQVHIILHELCISLSPAYGRAGAYDLPRFLAKSLLRAQLLVQPGHPHSARRPLTLNPRKYGDGLWKIADGNRDTQLSEQNYAKRTTTRPREAKNMKICSKNRSEGLYEPENAIFRPIYRFPTPTALKMTKK